MKHTNQYTDTQAVLAVVRAEKQLKLSDTKLLVE